MLAKTMRLDRLLSVPNRFRVCRYLGAGVAFLVGLTMTPVPAFAGCELGEAPSYQDVSGIAVRRCGTVGFIYESSLTADGYLLFHGVDNTPVKGYYEGHDGRVLFDKLLKTLQDAEFFSMRLKPTPTWYADGPCETVQVMRCGVVTSIGGIGTVFPFQADLKDSETARFVALVSQMQSLIFAWPWNSESGSGPKAFKNAL